MAIATMAEDVVVFPQRAARTDTDTLSLTFIGTATALLRFGGFTVLTDPNFLHHGNKIAIGYGLHATRRTDPAMSIAGLPPLDLVLLSHMHEDHFDREVARQFDKTLPIVTTHQAAHVLRDKGFLDTRPLRTWEAITFYKGGAGLRVRAMPGRHAPAPLLPLFPPVMGSMVELRTDGSDTRFRLYISGDTLLSDGLRKIPERFPDIDLALLHLGGTRVFGVKLTMDGEDGVRAMELIRPRLAVPVHYNDYDVFKSGLDDFRQAVRAAGVEGSVRYVAPGETATFAMRR